MSFRKFSQNDIVLNTMRAYPLTEFTIYNSKVYYSNTPHHASTLGTSSAQNNILSITSSVSGGISLYEYNVDRAGTYRIPANESPIFERSNGAPITTYTDLFSGSNLMINPYITKDSAGASFKTAGMVSYQNEFKYGDIIQMNYPLTASITREFMSPTPGFRDNITDADGKLAYVPGTRVRQKGKPLYPHFYALKNRLNHYRYLSEYYAVSSSIAGGWDKATEPLNVLYVPSIFYGSKISEGSLVMRLYITGTLAAELRDSKHNGELIQFSGSDNGYAKANDGQVAGVVMYNEGIILLTGSWALDATPLPLINGGPAAKARPSWLYWGAGANDGINGDTITDATFANAVFSLKFNGMTETQVQTMFAKAQRGQVNYSNNPTFIQYGQDELEVTGSQLYVENPVRKLKNFTSSSFATYNAPFSRQVYISRVGIYDENKNLLGIATLADPVLKEDDQDYTFKLKLDI